jgi:hypothetical protein
MSRTHKDAPAARRARAARRFADREQPFDYQPDPVPIDVLRRIPADPWDSFADPTLGDVSRLCAATALHLII